MNKVNNGNVRLGEWKAIKALLDNNLSVGQVSRMVGRAWGTVDLVRLSESFEDYREINHRRAAKAAAERAARVNNKQPSLAEVLKDGEEPAESKKYTYQELQELQATALLRIADALDILVARR